MEQIIKDGRVKMEKVVDLVSRDFGTLRTGRANPQLIEGVEINAYEGTPAMRLNTLATISAPDAKSLVVNPFDPSIIEKIERGIREADLGFNPVVDEKLIRINIPPLTEERRHEFVKLLGEKTESGKVMIRQARHEAMEKIKSESDGVSEDEIKRLEGEVQKLTDEYIGKIDDMKQQKEQELMQL